MSELTVLSPTELESALSEFLMHFENDYFSEAALTSLQKTFQTHNITIQDWNTVIEYLKQNVKNTDKVKYLIAELSKYIIKDNSVYLTTNKEGDELPSTTKDKYIIQGNDLIYPYTKHENVIGLQNTILEKMPIVSGTTPSKGITRQEWIQPIELNSIQDDPIENNPYDHPGIENILPQQSTLEDETLNYSSLESSLEPIDYDAAHAALEGEN